MKTALTIAGSDSSGGAGIQADIKTMMANGVYAMSVITAITAQNTLGVSDIMTIPQGLVKAQLDSVFTDIVPDSVKIGMVPDAEIAKVIAERLSLYKAKDIVVDPVMVATSGAKLVESDAVSVIARDLFPVATLITPNIPEAEVLSQMEIGSFEEMEIAGRRIIDKYGCNVLVKGGHLLDFADDLLICGSDIYKIEGKRLNNPNTHGTGCTLSSAISANLAKGYPLYDAVIMAKEYISGAISSGLDIGKGPGPLNHGYRI